MARTLASNLSPTKVRTRHKNVLAFLKCLHSGGQSISLVLTKIAFEKNKASGNQLIPGREVICKYNQLVLILQLFSRNTLLDVIGGERGVHVAGWSSHTHKHGGTESPEQQSVHATFIIISPSPPLSHPTPSSQQPAEQLRCES